MSVSYQAVNWNRQKRRYDLALAVGVAGSIGAFALVTAVVHPSATAEVILTRGIGLTAVLLLNLILAIGPLTRFDARFLPFLYNRRHLGVVLGLLSLAHGTLVLVQFHAFGNADPLVSVLTSHGPIDRLSHFPFEWFGILALGIIVLMAVTSHDFWMSALTAPVWKRLHLLVYVAYVSLILHVGFGFLQDEVSPFYVAVLGLAAALIGGLHLAAGSRERAADRGTVPEPEWVDIGAAADIAEGRAKIGLVAGERVAVFRHEGRLSCVSNVCRHQNGPLGEGRIIDGCITCPWHGYQYRPDTGTSPPPFNDRIATFDLRLVEGRVQVYHLPNPPGTPVEPVPAPAGQAPDGRDFYVGYAPVAREGLGRFIRFTAAAVLLLGIGTMAAFAAVQGPFDRAAFEYGTLTTVEGVVRTDPYPVLEVTRAEGGAPRVSRYLLAAVGKHGAQAMLSGFDGRQVRLTGSLAYRNHLTLLEVAQAELGSAPTPVGLAAPVDLGIFRLEGEFVDSKCYTGVMNPGRGVTHRGCAARCLAGGITPLFVTRNAVGETLELIVVGPGMAPLPPLAREAGRQITVRGRVRRQADLWFLELDA